MPGINFERLCCLRRLVRESTRGGSRSRPAPVHVGERALAPRRDGSLSHAWRATRTCVVSGVHRSFRPLPTHRTWAPAPRWTASLSRLISSERRKPVWAASRSKVWSRRPSHVVRSDAARIASISGRVRKCTCRLSCRLLVIARTRWMSALWAGSSNDTKRKKERMVGL
jgi:hypothetical protein